MANILLKQAVEQKKFDVRLREKNVQRGALSMDQVRKELSGLPDDGANAEWVSVDNLTNDDDHGSNGTGGNRSAF